MATELTTQKLAIAGDTFTLTGEALQAALLAELKADTRVAALRCHAVYRTTYGLESADPILGWCVIWKREWAIAEDDLVAVLRMSTAPGVSAEVAEAKGLRVWLSAKLVELQKRRTILKSQADRRAEYERDRVKAVQS